MDVVPLYQDWSFNLEIGNTIATRSYIDASFLPTATFVTLPSIGDSWDLTDWKNLIADTITVTYLQDNDNCAKKYKVDYSTKNLFFTEINDEIYPTTINVAGKYFQYYETENSSADYKWKWPDGSKANNVAFKKRIHTETMTIHRSIYGASLQSYISACITHIGNINSTVFLNIPVGLCLFKGVTVQERVGYDANRMWDANLTFEIMNIGAWDNDQGWNLAWRKEKKAFEIPTFNGHYLYNSRTFDELLSLGKAPPTVFPPYPNK